jgi:hypothetical protein
MSVSPPECKPLPHVETEEESRRGEEQRQEIAALRAKAKVRQIAAEEERERSVALVGTNSPDAARFFQKEYK